MVRILIENLVVTYHWKHFRHFTEQLCLHKPILNHVVRQLNKITISKPYLFKIYFIWRNVVFILNYFLLKLCISFNNLIHCMFYTILITIQHFVSRFGIGGAHSASNMEARALPSVRFCSIRFTRRTRMRSSSPPKLDSTFSSDKSPVGYVAQTNRL